MAQARTSDNNSVAPGFAALMPQLLQMRMHHLVGRKDSAAIFERVSTCKSDFL